MYLDVSSMRKTSMGGRQHWVMLVDEATKYKKSFFLKKKNEQVEPIIDWIKALKARHKIQVKIIRCDNAGENKVLERESDKNELGIIFEYTAPGTPPQNGVVERAFVTVMGRARAMINHAGFSMAKRQQLWCEAAQTATMLDNILVQESAVENSSSRFYLISCSQGILNSSSLSCYLLLRLLVYMYLSQLMRTFTNYLKCIVISS